MGIWIDDEAAQRHLIHSAFWILSTNNWTIQTKGKIDGESSGIYNWYTRQYRGILITDNDYVRVIKYSSKFLLHKVKLNLRSLIYWFL